MHMLCAFDMARCQPERAFAMIRHPECTEGFVGTEFNTGRRYWRAAGLPFRTAPQRHMARRHPLYANDEVRDCNADGSVFFLHDFFILAFLLQQLPLLVNPSNPRNGREKPTRRVWWMPPHVFDVCFDVVVQLWSLL